MSSKAINTILNLKDNFSKGIKSATSSTDKFSRQIKLAENQASKMKNTFSGAFGKIAALAGGISLGAFAKDSLMLASDLAEVENVVDTTFGKMNTNIYKFADTAASQFGISKLQAEQFSGTLGAMMKSSGISGAELTKMSTSLTGLAGDMASFYNLDPAEAFEKIKSAIGGETEPMKALGVNMSVTNMEAYALSKGINKSWESMTQAEQTTLRYNYLLENTKDAQGDYAKTSDSFANSLRTLKLNFQTLGANIMSNFIPVFKTAFNSINKFITSIDVNAWSVKIKNAFTIVKNSMQFIIPVLSGVAAGFLSFMVVSKVLVVFNTLKSVIAGTTTVLKALNLTILANPITWIAIAIGAAIAVGIYAYKHCEKFRNKINELWAGIKQFGLYLMQVIPPILKQFGDWFTVNILPALQKLGNFIINNILPTFMNLGNFFMTSILPILKQLALAFSTTVLPVLQQFGQFITETIIPTVISIGSNILQVLNTCILPLAEKVLNFLMPAFSIAFDTICGVLKGWFEIGQGIIEGFIKALNGIIEFVTGVLTGDWEKAFNGLKKAFDGVIDGIKKIWQGLIDLLSAPVKAVINVFKKEDGGDAGKDSASTSSGGKKKANATGTHYFSGGWTTVGEHGRELLKLPSGSKILPNSQTENALNKKGDVKVYVTVQGNIIGNEDYADYIGDHIVNKVQIAMDNM